MIEEVSSDEEETLPTTTAAAQSSKCLPFSSQGGRERREIVEIESKKLICL